MIKMQLYTSVMDLDLAQEIVVREHYLHRPVATLARPWAYGVFSEAYPDRLRSRHHKAAPFRGEYKSEPLAVFIFGIPHFPKLRGVFGNGQGQLDVQGLPLPTQWQTLMNFRNWVSPRLRELQGERYSISQHLAPIIRRLEVDYLTQWGVVDINLPYRIVQLISYSDVQYGHHGIMYKALGFEELGQTKGGYLSNAGGLSGRHTHAISSSKPNNRIAVQSKSKAKTAKTLWRLWLPKRRPRPIFDFQPHLCLNF